MFFPNRIKWALRKATLPLGRDALVLDVGSGGTPYPRSDVLIDRLEGAEHRCGQPMLIDRPTVFGDATKLPFKDKSFDYVIASHILEHMADPAKFLNEIQRVGKAGYIETPNFLYERLNPFEIHCLEIASVNGVLHIHKKSQHIEDAFLGGLKFLESNLSWKNLFFRRPEMFHVRYYWSGKIDYKIYNPLTSADWIEDVVQKSNSNEATGNYLKRDYRWRRFGLFLLGKFEAVRRNRRLKDFHIESVLACPECKGELHKKNTFYCCEICDLLWAANPHPNFCSVLNK
jgi:SAM-dependent methyltransferase